MKDNFLLKKNKSKVFEELSDEDAGKLIKGIFNYANNGDSKLDGYLRIIFLPIKDDMDENEEKYIKRCEINKANGSKGGAPKGNENAKKNTANDTSLLGETEEKEETTENNQSVKKTTENNMNNHNHIHLSYITNQDNRDIRVIGGEEEEVEIITDTKPYKKIIDYLNNKTNSNYKYTTKSTQQKINARLNEGYTLDDFIVVIDKKCSEWIGTEFEQYLCPETLFGTKFEKYLNQKSKGTKNNKTDSQFEILKGVYDGTIQVN